MSDDFVLFTCRTCGHSDMVHFLWIGRCLHGSDGFMPKEGDKTPCDCERLT